MSALLPAIYRATSCRAGSAGSCIRSSSRRGAEVPRRTSGQRAAIGRAIVASIRKYKTARADPRFEVRWRDGRRRDRCKTFKLRADAKRFLVDVERRQQLGPLYDAKPDYFGHVLDNWLA